MKINFKQLLIINIALIILLLLCLLDMPYGFYQLVRFVAMAGFALLCYIEYSKDNLLLSILFGCIALLFQPFFKIALGRELWNIVDVITSIILIIYSLNIYKKRI